MKKRVSPLSHPNLFFFLFKQSPLIHNKLLTNSSNSKRLFDCQFLRAFYTLKRILFFSSVSPNRTTAQVSSLFLRKKGDYLINTLWVLNYGKIFETDAGLSVLRKVHLFFKSSKRNTRIQKLKNNPSQLKKKQFDPPFS